MRIEILPRYISDSIQKINVGDQSLFFCTARFYLLEHFDRKRMVSSGHQVFADPVMESWHLDEHPVTWQSKEPDAVVEVGFHPGVTDNPACTAAEGMELLGLQGKIASGKVWFFWGDCSLDGLEDFAKRELANPLIERIKVEPYTEYVQGKRFDRIQFPHVSLTGSQGIEECPLDLSEQELEELSRKRSLALNKEEMRCLSKYFADEKVRKERKEFGLPSNPTDVELEILAQTWSEHCKHKIFAARIDYSEAVGVTRPLGERIVDGLYPTWIKGATQKIGVDWTKSVFSDNAGVVRMDSQIDFCIKVETHNSPSALDPYGGALTGILGVNRDIMGVGLGARPIANMDVFCLAPPSWPRPGEEEQMPAGIPFPAAVLRGVHRGVQDGGNKSGVPTINGAMLFDPSYGGKPLIFVARWVFYPRSGACGEGAKRLNERDGKRHLFQEIAFLWWVGPLERMVFMGRPSVPLNWTIPPRPRRYKLEIPSPSGEWEIFYRKRRDSLVPSPTTVRGGCPVRWERWPHW